MSGIFKLCLSVSIQNICLTGRSIYKWGKIVIFLLATSNEII